MIQARYYRILSEEKIRCELCPHMCELEPGRSGICRVRTNIDGKLMLTNYGVLTAVNMDPIEKKPLFHFYPNHLILSIGNNGCNLRCKCCQNWEISQTSTKNYDNFKNIEIKELVSIAKSKDRNIGIAFTYNEPIVWIEYMVEIAKQIKDAGLKNVLVSNGYINEEPLKELLEYIDAFNIDIKAFTEDKYQMIALSQLEPVKKTIKTIIRSGKHIELTNLVIPGFNDDKKEFAEIVKWVDGELGNETVLHLTRYFPAYKMKNPSTPVETLKDLHEIAKEKLKYVYLGNVNIENSQDTYCSKCNKKVIERKGYHTEIVALDDDGKCRYCNNLILKY